MTDPSTLAVSLVAGIWARESARGASLDRLNQIRDRILIGKIGSDDITHAHRKLMLDAHWRPIATGVVSVSTLFALVIGFISFLVPDGLHWSLVILCSVIGGYQLCGSISTASTLIRGAKVLREALK